MPSANYHKYLIFVMCVVDECVSFTLLRVIFTHEPCFPQHREDSPLYFVRLKTIVRPIHYSLRVLASIFIFGQLLEY